MSTIEENLAKIKTAVYGRDVRDAIHDSIEQCYTDTSTSATAATAAAQSANTQATSAQIAALSANTAATRATIAATAASQFNPTVTGTTLGFGSQNGS